MKHLACGLRRTPLPRTPLNKGKKEGPGSLLRANPDPPKTPSPLRTSFLS